MNKETVNLSHTDVYSRDAWITVFPNALRKPLLGKIDGISITLSV